MSLCRCDACFITLVDRVREDYRLTLDMLAQHD